MQKTCRLLTVEEFSRKVGITPKRAYSLAKQLPHGVVVKLGGSLRFDDERVDQWLAAGGSLAS